MTLWDLLKPLTDALSGQKPAKKQLRAKGVVKQAKPAAKAVAIAAKPPINKPAVSKPVKLGPAAMANAGLANSTVSAAASTASSTKRRPPARKRRVQPPSGQMSGATESPVTSIEAPASPASPAKLSMEERYEAMTREMLAKYNVRVRKWRTSMSGIAWYVTYRDGHVQKLIESPKPKGPMSAAIFLHEIGHHAIGFNVYKPRCLEEYHAWQFSLREMERFGFNISEGVQRRVFRSLRYAVAKAQRRGIREVPAELTPYIPTPARNRI